ncbi:unnamed protein product [Boreogadus saida]
MSVSRFSSAILQLCQPVAVSAGRHMAWATMIQRAIWLSHTAVPERERAGLVQGPLAPDGLFGPRFSEVLAHQQAVRSSGKGDRSRRGPRVRRAAHSTESASSLSAGRFLPRCSSFSRSCQDRRERGIARDVVHVSAVRLTPRSLPPRCRPVFHSTRSCLSVRRLLLSTWRFLPRRQGKRVLFYLDKLLILSDSEEAARRDTMMVINHLSFLGFAINWEKSFPLPGRQIVY